MKLALRGRALVVDLGRAHRSVSSAVLGGGLATMRTWVNLQVSPDYSRTDPERHLREEARGLPGPVVGMLTAASVERFRSSRHGSAHAIATVGVRHALAAVGTRPRSVPRVGTINLLVVVDASLTDGGLVGAVQTAVEAKAQALAATRVGAANADGFATGTATDAICVSCVHGARVPFAGPATRIGGDIARAVYEAVLAGVIADRGAESIAESTREVSL